MHQEIFLEGARPA